MKISKGTVKNINKKILAGTLTLVLLTTPLQGCSIEDTRFEYSANEQGNYEVSGNIGYNKLKGCYFLVIENVNYNTKEYYVAYRTLHNGYYSSSYNTYENVFNEQTVFNDNTEDNSRIMSVCEKIENYLFATSNIKASYTKEDVEKILNEMKEIYLKENNKQLVKE